MKITELKSGDIFCTVVCGLVGQKLYRFSRVNISGRVECWQEFRQGKIMLSSDCNVQVYKDSEVDCEF